MGIFFTPYIPSQMKYIPHFDDASNLLSSSDIRHHYKQNELDTTAIYHLKETNFRTQDSFVLNSFALNATITVERDMTTAPAAGGSRN